jgi:predicted Fe-Mo cluster-binding NifX family protein
MRIALTVWDGWISPVFDVCRQALVLEIVEGNVLNNSAQSLDGATPLQKGEQLLELGVRTLICGAISGPAREQLTARGLKVIGFVAGEVDEVLQAFLAGDLPTPALSMPGCADLG